MLYQSDLAYIHAAAFEVVANGAAGEIVRRLQSGPTRIRSVLDVGCGAGPLTRAFVDAGFNVTGIDISAEMLDRARARVPSARFIHTSAYDTSIHGYDAVVAFGESLTYHAEGADADANVSRFFQHAAEAIPPGGQLIFDVIGLGEPSLTGRTWRSGNDWAVLVETTEDQMARSLVRDIEIFRCIGEHYRRSREVHRIQLFDVPMLCNQLESHGFSTETSQSCGNQKLPPRRHAFFATRVSRRAS